ALGFAAAADQLYAFHRRRGEPRRARHWLRVAARLEHPGAAFELARVYEARSPKESHAWLKRAANFADAAACRMLGWQHDNGFGTRASPRKARLWYRRAAALGDAIAAFNLGLIRYRARKQPTAAAMAWFTLAASRGHRRAAAFCRTRDPRHLARFI
ncbi:MAG: sel1 repeat family protein, partial [Deltaproteobacteria bacterium]|nr:sel1 repeat family protein [Deltaproteobacteria bacterium]